ncbi:MAG: hypothetical protein NT150_09360, partial [Bacteroidetes bacterium]|nr:hypothetical protein [Bacteroidota bacterium]
MKSINLTSIFILIACNVLLGQTTTSTYYFAHSLISHEKLTNNQANIPFWLAELEIAAGDVCLTSGKFAAGQFGAGALPPTQTWSFYYQNDNHGSAMLPDGSYVAGTHDNIVLTYMNWELVDDWGGSIGSRNAQTVSKAKDSIAVIFNWMNTNDPGRNLYLYECWPKIETNYILNGQAWTSNTGNPPNATQWANYTQLALGHQHDFYRELQDSLITNSGISNTKVIPSSMICAKLWQPGGLLQDFTVTDLFVDGGPHGKPSAYFLAAMIVYAAQHGTAPTLPFSSHAQIDQRILDRFSQISTFIMSELTAFNFPNSSSRVWKNTITNIEKSVQLDESKITLYPNPANNHITLDFGGNANLSGYNIKITNTLGTTVFTTAINQKTSNVDL